MFIKGLNEYSIRYFLEHNQEDFSEIAPQKAMDACEKHAAYHTALGHGSHIPQLEKAK